MFFFLFFLFFLTGIILIGGYYPSKKKIIGIFIFIIITLIVGFRKGVDKDYKNYIDWYLFKTRDNRLEDGYVAIMDLFRWLNLSPTFLFFFFSFFTCFFVYEGIKKYTVNSNIALLFYIMIPGLYLTSFVILRQSFSVAISFYAFYYLINKKYFVFFILMLIGISIHNTCLIALFLFLIVFKYGNRIKINHLYGVIVFSFCFSLLDFMSVFKVFFENTRYLYYFSDKIMSVSIWKVLIINIEGILILFYLKKYKPDYPYNKNLVILYCFSIVFLNLFRDNEDLTRIANYFRIFEIVLIADLVCWKFNAKKIILFFFFYFLYLGAFFTALKKDLDMKDSNMPKYIPYNNILWSSFESVREVSYKKIII